MPVKVLVEHWFRDLAFEIKKMVPDADISSMIGRTGSFEVMINGKLAFSRLQTKIFPSTSKVVHMVAEVSQYGTDVELEVEEAKKKKKCAVQ